MTKEKDFLGKDITEVIEKACRDFGVSQDELDIEILETGSAGIFGLCKKQAHIRVRLKKVETEAPKESVESEEQAASVADTEIIQEKEPEEKQSSPSEKAEVKPAKETRTDTDGVQKPSTDPGEAIKIEEKGVRDEPIEPPSQEALDTITSTIVELLEHMGYPAKVDVTVTGNAINCVISGDHEEHIIGPEGRTLDSLQYLLRKMLLHSLNDKYMLALDAGDFRRQRAEELKQRALELAAQVKEDGKTQAIPALNPSERRIVHMVLQEDKGVRSRSVGEGLFKKVLVYKPGKGRRSGGRKKRG